MATSLLLESERCRVAIINFRTVSFFAHGNGSVVFVFVRALHSHQLHSVITWFVDCCRLISRQTLTMTFDYRMDTGTHCLVHYSSLLIVQMNRTTIEEKVSAHSTRCWLGTLLAQQHAPRMLNRHSKAVVAKTTFSHCVLVVFARNAFIHLRVTQTKFIVRSNRLSSWWFLGDDDIQITIGNRLWLTTGDWPNNRRARGIFKYLYCGRRYACHLCFSAHAIQYCVVLRWKPCRRRDRERDWWGNIDRIWDKTADQNM